MTSVNHTQTGVSGADASRDVARLRQATVDALSAHVCVLDAAGGIRLVNSAWRQFSRDNGPSPNPTTDVGANYLAVCDTATGASAERASEFAAGIRDVAAGRCAEYRQEYECHSPARRRWFVGTVTAFLDSEDTGLVVAHQEVTERKIAEFALRDAGETLAGQIAERSAELASATARLRSEIEGRRRIERSLERYQLLANHSRDIVLFVRRSDGRIIEGNEAALRAYGFGREELLSLTIHDLRAPETQAAVDRQMATASDEGILFETVHHRRDGSVFSVEVSSCGVSIAGERVLLSIIRDVTDRKRAEAEREQLISQLNAALASVKTLRGFIPICAACKKIRDDAGYWQSVEVYVRERTEAEFSHGLCPECAARYYPDYETDAPPSSRSGL